MTIDPGSGQPVGGGQPPAGGDSPASDRLRSMLAQAVEGQRDEQREISGALGDMRNQLLRLGQEVAAIRASGGAEGTDASTINNVTVELREAVRFLSERLDGVTRMVAQRGEELADIRGALTAIDAHVRSQAETVAMLSQGLQALPSYGERVSALQDNVDRVQQRLGEIRNVVARPTDTSHLDQRLAAIEGTLAPIADQLTQARQASADHSATLADQSATLAEQAAAMAEHRSSLGALHERLEALAAGTQAALAVPPVFDDSSIQALDVQLSALATTITAIRNDVAGLVESGASGSGAAVDTSEFATAVAAAEERMREHVDEAVLALAEMLLRRRMPPSAFDPPSVGEAAGATASDSLAWWERDDTTAVTAGAVDAVQPDEELPIVDFSAADIADEDGEDGGAADGYSDAEYDEDEDGEAAEYDEDEDGEAAEYDEDEDEDDEDEYDEDEDEDEYDEDEDDEDEDEDEEGEFGATGEIPVLPPEAPPVEPPSYPPRSSSWSPEVPTERPEVDPPDTAIPERKKRWFRG